jgi:xanthine dehydrogenase accessory factor
MQDENKEPSQEAIAVAVARVLASNAIAALATLIEAPLRVGAKLLIEESEARTGTLGDPALDHLVAGYAKTFLDSRAEARSLRIQELTDVPQAVIEGRILFERIEPEPRVVICGAGHVGASLARLAGLLGYRTVLIDDRADFVKRERFPEREVELVAASSWTEALRTHVGGGRGVYVAVVTRGHNEDEECMRAAISSKAEYVGLIGSKRRTNIVLDRLRKAGVAESRLQAVRAPIGLDIGAVSPQEVALAILAEIVAKRRGGSGEPLSTWRRET